MNKSVKLWIAALAVALLPFILSAIVGMLSGHSWK